MVNLAAKGIGAKPLLVAACWALCLGCGPTGPPLYSVEGEVSFDGQPIPAGHISFIPEDSKGRTAATKIENGQYATEARAGEYKVKIQASREVGPMIESMGERAREHYIPSKYNLRTTLSKTVEPQDNVFQFQLEP